MAKKQAAAQGPESIPGVQKGTELPQPKEKPVHEVRIGRVKAVIWQNQTESGPRHNVTFRRLFKRDQTSQWEQSDSFGRDELPLIMEVAREAWRWIYDHGQG